MSWRPRPNSTLFRDRSKNSRPTTWSGPGMRAIFWLAGTSQWETTPASTVTSVSSWPLKTASSAWVQFPLGHIGTSKKTWIARSTPAWRWDLPPALRKNVGRRRRGIGHRWFCATAELRIECLVNDLSHLSHPRCSQLLDLHAARLACWWPIFLM